PNAGQHPALFAVAMNRSAGAGSPREAGSSAHGATRQMDQIAEACPQLVVQASRHVAGGPFCADALLLRNRALQYVWLALFVPFLGREAVAYGGVEILSLHQLQRLLMAEIVPRPVQADICNCVDGQSRIRDLDAAHAALAHA